MFLRDGRSASAKEQADPRMLPTTTHPHPRDTQSIKSDIACASTLSQSHCPSDNSAQSTAPYYPPVAQDSAFSAWQNIPRTPTILEYGGNQSANEKLGYENLASRRTVRIQHVLTAKYLTSHGSFAQLSDLPNEWAFQKAGPGYTLALQSPKGRSYLAPTSHNNFGKRALCLSPFPAPWEIYSQYGGQDATLEDVEWVCKLRWAFSGQCVLAGSNQVWTSQKDMNSVPGSSVWLNSDGSNMADGPAELHMYWRLKFLK